MTSYFSDGIEHETSIEDDKREGTYIIVLALLFICCFNKSLFINDSTKTSENLTSYQPLSRFHHTILSNRHDLTYIDVLSTDILTLTHAISNISCYDGNGRCNNIIL